MTSTDPAPPSVLIVDESEDSREVLRTALTQRGMQIYEAVGARQGLEMARRHRPGVIVLDLEAVPAADPSVCDDFHAQTRLGETSMVLLGNERRQSRSLPDGQFVSKPYHYGPLVRTIEALLGCCAEA